MDSGSQSVILTILRFGLVIMSRDLSCQCRKILLLNQHTGTLLAAFVGVSITA